MEKAEGNFEKIKRSIEGIYSVIEIVLSREDLIYQIALDNVLGVYANILQLLFNKYDTRQFIKKLRDAKIETDIPL